MAIYRFFSSFSMETDDQFLGSLTDDGDNSFRLTKEGVGEDVAFAGEFFTKATGTRDGTIKSFFGGTLADDDQGNPTDVILFVVNGTNMDVDRSQFDSRVLSGNSLEVWSLLTADDDLIFGSADNDELRSGAGDDRMSGGAGNDELRGGSGEDTLIGGAGNDFIDSGSGDGFIRSGGGSDTVIGRGGVDTIIAGGGADTVNAGAGADTIKAGGGADNVSGGGGDDSIKGGGGDDVLSGQGENDRIIGGGGEDTIEGGIGDDRITGGSRGDTFVFRGNSGDDVVTDYRDGVDMIRIDGGLSFADIDIQNVGANTLLTFGGASVTLLTQEASELTVDDFIF